MVKEERNSFAIKKVPKGMMVRLMLQCKLCTNDALVDT